MSMTKTHLTYIVYQPFSRVPPPSFTLYGWFPHLQITVKVKIPNFDRCLIVFILLTHNKRKHHPELGDSASLIRDIDLNLVHTNFFVDYPRLTAPNTKYVGGMHIRTGNLSIFYL